MIDNRIRYISEPIYSGISKKGYKGPGWYFWNEEWTQMYGPFESKDMAQAVQSMPKDKGENIMSGASEEKKVEERKSFKKITIILTDGSINMQMEGDKIGAFELIGLWRWLLFKALLSIKDGPAMPVDPKTLIK